MQVLKSVWMAKAEYLIIFFQVSFLIGRCQHGMAPALSNIPYLLILIPSHTSYPRQGDTMSLGHPILMEIFI